MGRRSRKKKTKTKSPTTSEFKDSERMPFAGVALYNSLFCVCLPAIAVCSVETVSYHF